MAEMAAAVVILRALDRQLEFARFDREMRRAWNLRGKKK
jgi:hypothetical protein